MPKSAAAKTRRRESGPPQLGQQLRDAAIRRGLSTSALSALADVDRRVVGQWLKGAKDITLTTAGRIAAALGLRLAEGPGRKPSRTAPPADARSAFEVARPEPEAPGETAA